jgi:uncharacterized membrane protein
MSCRLSVAGPHARAAARVAAVLAMVAFLAAAATGALGSSRDDLLTLFPLFLLIAVMVLRPYAGERLIARLRGASKRRPPAPARIGLSRPLRLAILARGGRLIATAMAGRAPPPARADCC